MFYSSYAVTDSGGITEEASVKGIPCITPRDSTERPETVEIGTNELIGADQTSNGIGSRSGSRRLVRRGWLRPSWQYTR